MLLHLLDQGTSKRWRTSAERSRTTTNYFNNRWLLVNSMKTMKHLKGEWYSMHVIFIMYEQLFPHQLPSTTIGWSVDPFWGRPIQNYNKLKFGNNWTLDAFFFTTCSSKHWLPIWGIGLHVEEMGTAQHGYQLLLLGSTRQWRYTPVNQP